MKFLVIALIGFTLPLFANDMEMEKGEGPCKADREKFCKEVEPGEGRIAKCLKSHEAELSETCKAKKTEMKEKMKDFKEACEADIKAHCADSKPGKGRIVKCLKSKEASLSAECKESLPGKGRK